MHGHAALEADGGPVFGGDLVADGEPVPVCDLVAGGVLLADDEVGVVSSGRAYWPQRQRLGPKLPRRSTIRK